VRRKKELTEDRRIRNVCGAGDVYTLFAGQRRKGLDFGARSRQRWNMFKRSAQRHLQPGIFIELAPTGEGEAPFL
jgi:hypothetical protein